MKTTIPRKTTAIFCTAVVCGSLFTGCNKAENAVVTSQSRNTMIQISQTVTLGNIPRDTAAQVLTVADADIAELQQKLHLFPSLERLVLEGKIPDSKQLLELQTDFPDISLVFPVIIGESSVSSDTEILDLSGTAIDFTQLQEVLPLLSGLQEINILDTGLEDFQKMALADTLSDVLIRCELPLADQYFASDSIEIDISGSQVTVEEVEHMLPYFSKLKKLDMSFCGITDQEMDALNQRYPDISIVWTVMIGQAKTRTDAVYFYPAEINYYPTNEEMKKLRYCTELVAIDIGHTRATDCEFLWYTPKVRYLILADTGITDITPVGNLKDLIYLELFNLRMTDYSPLLNCTKLQDLNIGTTHADPEPLSKMTWLHNLQWHRADQNPATKDAVLKLPEQLPDTNVELYPKKKARNIGGGWRYLPNYYVFRDIIGATYFNQDQIWDYWGDEDGNRIMACENGKSFSAYTLAEIVAERLENGERIIGLKTNDSEKAEILYQTLMEAESWIKKG